VRVVGQLGGIGAQAASGPVSRAIRKGGADTGTFIPHRKPGER